MSQKRRFLYGIHPVCTDDRLILERFLLTVSPSHPAVMIADGDEVVHRLTVGGVDDVGRHVQALERVFTERNLGTVFLP